MCRCLALARPNGTMRYIDGRQVPFRQHRHECRMAKVARVLADLFAATGPFQWDWFVVLEVDSNSSLQSAAPLRILCGQFFYVGV
jgi:hypothetical protein